jgi:hypothetical protein
VTSNASLGLKPWSLVVALLFCSCALAQQAAPEFRGTWTATVGPTEVLRGNWTAQTLARRPNAARGSWTLLSEASQVLLEGTWSAQKTGPGWQGRWTARRLHGRSYSGTWRADIADLSGKTFRAMLERAVAKEIAGSWRSGGYQGNWWLEGSPPPSRRR